MRFNELTISEFYENYITEKTIPTEMFPCFFSNSENFQNNNIKTHLILSDIIRLNFKETGNYYEYATTFNQEYYLRFTIATMLMAYLDEKESFFRKLRIYLNDDYRIIPFVYIELEDKNTGYCSVKFELHIYSLFNERIDSVTLYTALNLDMKIFNQNAFDVFTNFNYVDPILVDYYQVVFKFLYTREIIKNSIHERQEFMGNFWLIKCLAFALFESGLVSETLNIIRKNIDYNLIATGDLIFNIGYENEILINLYDNLNLNKIPYVVKHKTLNSHTLQ